MNEQCKEIFNKIGLETDLTILNDYLIPREQLLNNTAYENIKVLIPDLRKVLSSSSLTSLHQNAAQEQRWPLINLIRQILTVYKYVMTPIRKSDGYTVDGVKKYKRYFYITKKVTN